MSNWRIVVLALKTEEDIVAARQRARQIAAAVGFDNQDQARIATSVSEIARNAVTYGKGGQIEFALDESERPQTLSIAIKDRGPGIKNLQTILDGGYRSQTGLGKGIMGARRLMDGFDIRTSDKGTTVTLSKNRPRLARALSPKQLSTVADSLSQPSSPLEELREQNRELLQSLQDLSARSSELEQLTAEIESTNRGVVALHSELESTAHELRRASELKTRFLSNMSHEFRTPLNSILALTRLLIDRTDGDLSDEQMKQVRFIADAAEGLTELVDDLLDIAKVEAGKLDIHPARFSVSELFGALRGLLKPLKTNDAIDLIFEEPSGVPILYNDEAKITQILRNFISNALKYTTKGSVTVSAQFKEPDRILFTVRDTGIGIAKEDHDRIFREFEQVPSILQSRVKGTGLGLPLSKRLAELLHGHVAVDSALGEGSSFFLEVPARWSHEEQEPFLPDWDKQADKPRILVADDEEAFRYVMRRMIDTQKYEIIEASDGESALLAVHASSPDVVILDLNMPRRDGYGVLEEMGRSEKTRNIPVIVSSSLVLSDIDRARLSRSRAILSKASLSPDVLSSALSDALRPGHHP
jgi:signal transduction histidine kinase